MTQIYHASLSRDIHDLLMQNYWSRLSDDFRNKVLRYRRWQDAQLSLLGRILLQYGFESLDEPFSDKDLIFTDYNKPILKNSRVKFNISHSGDVVVCVLTDVAEVGIDIEAIKEINIQDFKSQMTEGEWERVSTAEAMEKAFYTYWTQKEAVIKAHGMGLSLPLKSFEVIDNYCKISEESFFLKEIQFSEQYNCHLAFKDTLDSDVLNPQKLNLHPAKLADYMGKEKISGIFY